MSRYDRQLRALQATLDNACDCCDHERDPAPEPIEREPYADRAREWAGVETRERAFLPSNWQEGDIF